MKKTTRILAAFLAGLLCLSMGCSRQKEEQQQKPGESAQTTPNPRPDEEPGTAGVELYIYNSKGENAAQFEQLCQAYTDETGIAVRSFSIGAGQDHMETLRAEMNSKKKPAIFGIQGLKELQEWEEGGFALDFNDITYEPFKQLAQEIPESLRLSSDRQNSYGVPYNVEGYGFIVDKQMLSDLFEEDTDALLQDIIACSYQEWSQLVESIDAYIQAPASAPVTLNGNQYHFRPEKTGLAVNLNGVFSVMGAEKWTYGDHYMNVALNAVFDSPAAANEATEEEIDSVRPALVAFSRALDFKTSHLAGLNGAGKRGQDFVSSANYGYDQAVQIFADSKAVFFKQGNWAYGNIEGVNEAMAKRLTFVPVKMPLTQDMIKTGMTVEEFNSTIPVFVPNYYAINAKVSAQEQQAAMDFLIWMNTSETGRRFLVDEFAFIPYNADPEEVTLENPLSGSILEYMKKGKTLSAPYNGAPASWSGDTVGLRIMEQYMTKAQWEEQDYNDIADYAISTWKEMRQGS